MTRAALFAILALGPAAGCAAAQVEAGGWVDYQTIIYRERLAPASLVGRNQLRLQPELRARFSTAIRLFAGVEIRGDLADPTRNRAYLDEAYVDLVFGRLDIRLGRQVLAWGRADAANPTDFFGARDLTDILDSDEEEVAQAGVRANWLFGSWALAIVAVPRFSESLLPVPGSRWWPPLGDGPGGLPIRAVLEDADEPIAGRSAWGARASGSAGRVDMALSVYRGPWHLPVLEVGPARSDPSTGGVMLPVAPTYYRLTAIGADFAAVLGRVGVHGEAAAYLTDDGAGLSPSAEASFLRYVVGADHTVRDILGGRDIVVIGEWMQDIRLTNDRAPWSGDDLNHVFRRSLFLRTTLPLGDYSSLDVQGVYDTERRGWVVQLESRWSPRDGLEIRLGVDLPDGPPESFFGAFRSNRRLHTRIRTVF